jgi:hypothetical protein
MREQITHIFNPIQIGNQMTKKRNDGNDNIFTISFTKNLK